MLPFMRGKSATGLGCVNLGVLALVLLMLSPLARQSGPMSPILLPFFYWAILSFLPAVIGLGLALSGLQVGEPVRWSVAGLLTNGPYLLAYVAFVVYRWPALMGI